MAQSAKFINIIP